MSVRINTISYHARTHVESAYLGEVVDKSNLGLCHMSHVRIANLQ